jgi:8-oxo-dGTP pyrophosphatase MutT (NUDIX family)
MNRTQSAGGIVLNTKGEVLVVNQRGDSWSLPKGHIDAGEDALAAAKREIAEESGVTDLEFVKDLGGFQRHRIGLHGGDDLSELKDIHIFLFRTRQSKLRPVDPENPEARWVGRQDVADLLTHHKDKEYFRSILSELPD